MNGSAEISVNPEPNEILFGNIINNLFLHPNIFRNLTGRSGLEGLRQKHVTCYLWDCLSGPRRKL